MRIALANMFLLDFQYKWIAIILCEFNLFEECDITRNIAKAWKIHQLQCMAVLHDFFF